MKIAKTAKRFALIGAVVLALGAVAYGVAYHTGAEVKIESAVVAAYDNVQNGVVSTYQNVQGFFTGGSGNN